MTVKWTWEIRIKNGNECIASVTVPEYTQVDVSPVYERCGESEPALRWSGEIKLNPKWDGEIAMGKPPCSKVVWHRVDEVLPSKSSNYLGSTIGRNTTWCFSFDVEHSEWRLYGKITREVFFWTEIPVPPDECMIGVGQ